MKKLSIYIIVFLLAVILSIQLVQASHVSQDAQSSPTPTPPLLSLQILPFEQTVKDLSNGWNFTTVALYYVNSSNVGIFPQQITVNGITVETKEGKIYPATLTSYQPYNEFSNMELQSLISKLEFADQPSDYPQSLNIGNASEIPPLLPFWNNTKGELYLILFKSATVAHPTQIVISTANGLVNVDLTAPVPDDIPQPASITVHAMSELPTFADISTSAFDLKMGTETVIGMFNNCEIPYHLLNKDGLDELDIQLPFMGLVYMSDNTFSVINSYFLTAKAGPGQNAGGSIVLGNPVNETTKAKILYLAYFKQDGTTAVFNLDCPLK